ncbi:hypothetical protein IWW38_001723 [Coemansia aciculifera]|uniref:Uncharacterized protein n=1 Tax=Coemansia aciculifera TaxID=417176 RepID=A0ACC1M6K9_9FUNG|nr:hypothetical protein IWW38_001723 [Coemansia aciculifera]
MPFSRDASFAVQGKVALVTGALGAIGKQITQQLLDGGARVVMADIVNDGSGETASRELDGDNTRYVQVDLCSIPDIQRMLDEATQAFGHVDILINNAGMALYNRFYTDETSDNVATAIDLNLRAPIETTRLFVKMLKDSGRQGAVVNVASSAGMMPRKGFEIYGTTKAGLIYFTQASQYLAPQVRISAVAPYFVDTPMVRRATTLQNTPILSPHILITVNDVADAVVAQVKDCKSAGSTVFLVGSWSRLPVWMFSLSNMYMTLVIVLCMMVGHFKSACGMPSGSKYLILKNSKKN